MDELLATTMQHAREAIESQIRIESPLMDWLKEHPGYRLPWHRRMRYRWRFRFYKLRHMLCCDHEEW